MPPRLQVLAGRRDEIVALSAEEREDIRAGIERALSDAALVEVLVESSSTSTAGSRRTACTVDRRTRPAADAADAGAAVAARTVRASGLKHRVPQDRGSQLSFGKSGKLWSTKSAAKRGASTARARAR